MTGGSDYDVFVFTAGGGSNVVKDFSGGAGATDMIDVSAFGYASAASVIDEGVDDGLGNAVFTLNDGSSFTLEGVEIADLSTDDFLF